MMIFICLLINNQTFSRVVIDKYLSREIFSDFRINYAWNLTAFSVDGSVGFTLGQKKNNNKKSLGMDS